MTLTPSPLKISEAARLAKLLNAHLVARPGRLALEALSVPGMTKPDHPAAPPNRLRTGA